MNDKIAIILFHTLFIFRINLNFTQSHIRQTKIGVRTIKQLMADLTGKDPSKISTFSALFGKASPVIKEARSQFWKTMLPQHLLFATSTVMQEVGAQKLKRKYGSNSMISTMGIPMAFQAIQGLGGLLGKGGTMLQTFADTRIAQEAGEQLSADNYATLLEAASKEIKALGGKVNHNTVLIAQYYAINQTPIAEVMKDVNAGKDTLMHRSQEGKQAIEQLNAARHASLEAQQEQAAQANAVSDTAASPVQGAGTFTSQERNQPKGQGGFVEKALAGQGQAASNGIG